MNSELGNLTAADLAKPFDAARFTYGMKEFFCKECLHHINCHYKENGLTKCTACGCTGCRNTGGGTFGHSARNPTGV